jgi:hypothetical protein
MKRRSHHLRPGHELIMPAWSFAITLSMLNDAGS